MFAERISSFIEKNSLLSHDGLHLVALSGGADSVALMTVLLELGYHIEAIHCNFNLRGDESVRDEEFCKSLCQAKGVNLHLAHFDTRFYSQQHHISIEMAARELRYNYFRQLRQELEAESICVAHHKDDNAETVLLNLVRGTGIAGLTGIHPRNNDIVRPLLCVSRKEIEDYLILTKQTFITDSTNLINDVKRNKMRLDVMPLLLGMNPSATDAITTMARHLNGASALLEDAINRYEAECVRRLDIRNYNNIQNSNFHPISVDISRLRNTPSPEYLLYSIFSRCGITPQLTAQVFEHLGSQTGTSWKNNGLTITIDRGHLLIEPQQAEFRELRIPMVGRYNLCNGDTLEVSVHDKTSDFCVDTSADIAQLDDATVQWPLVIRSVRNGDRFNPFGMNGTKLVSDILTDRKMSLSQKRHQLCLTDASNQILWLTGLRISNKHRITSHTIKYVRVRYIKKSTDN